MASLPDVRIDAKDAPRLAFSVPDITDAQASKLSRLLTENHQRHHIFFNSSYFHNHITHHLVTIYGLGATPEELQTAYDDNANYQRVMGSPKESFVADLSNADVFISSLGRPSHYASFLAFFNKELEKHGVADVLKEYLFSDSPQAAELFPRLFAGIIHPWLHFGFALETGSLPLMAEALAMTAVHRSSLAPYFEQAELLAQDLSTPPSTLMEIIDSAKSQEAFLRGASSGSGDFGSAFLKPSFLPKVAAMAAQYRLDPKSNSPLKDASTAVAEQMATLALVTMSSQNPAKRIKLDFYMIHVLNASLFLPAITSSPLIPGEAAQRLVEWKARYDMLVYAQLRCPTLYPSETKGLQPSAELSDWQAIFNAACAAHDDGHLPKVVRALAGGEHYCKTFENEPWCALKGDEWRRMAALAIESSETSGSEPQWIRNAGLNESWNDVPARL